MQISEKEIEVAARAIAEAWGDKRLSREDYRMVARAALEAAACVRADRSGQEVK